MNPESADSDETALVVAASGRGVRVRDEVPGRAPERRHRTHGATTTWTYDPAWRRVTEHGPAGDRRFSYDTAHRLTTINNPTGTTTLDWDDAGRRTAEQHPDGSTVRYRWDPLGRLQAVTGRDGTTVRFGVDAQGQLRGVTTATGSLPLVWDAVGGVAQVRQMGDTQVIGAVNH